MNRLIQALKTMVELLDSRDIPYMVIGGIANSIYGIPRQTFDIDIKVQLQTDGEVDALIKHVESTVHIVPDKPGEFIRETNVLPVEIDDVRVDLILAVLPYEKEAINRSRVVGTFGFNMKVCQPEDLIIQKAVSKRLKDWADIEAIIENQGDELDREYLLTNCDELSRFLDDRSIHGRIAAWLDAD